MTAAPASATLPARSPDRSMPVWQAPLLPLALAATAGIVLDRLANIPLAASLGAALLCIVAFVVCRGDARRLLPPLYLWTACAAMACAWHHGRHSTFPADDIRYLADTIGRPARVRGYIDTPPTLSAAGRADPLRTMAKRDAERFILRVSAMQDAASQRWRSASGLLQVTAPRSDAPLAVGDGVELVGRLALPEAPGNPGEFDYAAYLADRDISALLTVREAGAIVVHETGSLGAWSSWPARLQNWGQRVLARSIPGTEGDLAAALLLGDSPGMTTDDWDLYLRSGVIHVLAISGQHLVVLATLLWVVLRLARVRRRHGAIVVAVVLFAYALVAGGRPPVMRSAWMVLALTSGILLRRPSHPASTFCFAWLLVALWNPADIFNAGCQLSFLAVAVLIWGVPGIATMADIYRLNLFGNRTALDRVIDESRPMHLRAAHRVARVIGEAYLLNALVWLAVTPLAASHFHLVSPIALLLGPPLVLLTALALGSGFGVLLLAPLAGPLAWPFALLTRMCLALCTSLTEIGAALPGAYFYLPNIPLWWLVPFYTLLLFALALRVPARRPVTAFALLLAGLTVGFVATLWPHRPGEFRCTFLAVGHGGCAVIETTAGRTLVYDVGSIAGPDLARRQVAPFLWSRGIRRIDELILSHADLDHFNGIPGLLERFPVGTITHTPTFPQRDMEAMTHVLRVIERRGIPMRTVSAGDRWSHDDVTIDVLHPPAVGPDGKENVRSLVLVIRHRELSLLLTGDLEDDGLQRVLALAPTPVNVLMAPHHGSARSSTPALARWAAPELVIMCQGKGDDTSAAARAYDGTRSTVLGTWPHGAVTVRHDGQDTWVEAFRTGQRVRLHAAAEPEG